ncbi:MAG: leucine-rich repeat protein [Muribaculaceae bacterium]|nr:leucine-rich repeat protein [Muribaculaceae bacterium]
MRFINKLLSSLLFLAIAAMLPQEANAYAFMVDGLCYNITYDGVVVTSEYSDGGYSNLSGALNIPESVTYNGTTYSVTGIGCNAFSHCTGLTSVTIPNSVTLIEDGAFYCCSGLTSVTIPNSVILISHNAFKDCSCMTSVTIGSSVAIIRPSVFDGCVALKTVNWNVESYPDFNEYDSPFINLTDITTFTFGDTVKRIPAFLCCGLRALSSIIIPQSVTEIGDWAFINCTGLTSLTIGNSVASIGDWAFYGCTSLTSLTIPNSVISIGWNSFGFCTGLTSIIIPNSVTTISQEAFGNCCGLTSVTIPNSVTSIGEGAFEGCSGLTSLIIPNSVTSIGDGAFYGCSSLTSLIIPNSVTSIGFRSFSYCSNLSTVSVEGDNIKYDSRNNCNAIIETETNSLLFGSKNTMIPGSVKSISNSAFAGCTGLTSVIIPYSVISIGQDAFSECAGLKSVALPNTITSIGDYCFYGCTCLSELIFTGQGAWSYNGNWLPVNQLKTINIGCEINSLGNFQFAPDVVNSYAAVPPSCQSSTFTNYNGELHVPLASAAAYFTANYWKNFDNLVNDLNEKVTLNKTYLYLDQDDSVLLTAMVEPQENEVLWSTTNPSVATVSETGIVTSTGIGVCDIYATLASNAAVYATCHVVSVPSEINILLSDEYLEMIVGEEKVLSATITPADSGLTPAWSSSDLNVATVENGIITAVGEGECDITATVLDKIATCHVKVFNNVIISLSKGNEIIGTNQILTVYPTCSPDVPVDLVVTSSNPSVAVARVVNRAKAPIEGLTCFLEKGMALEFVDKFATNGNEKAPALAGEKAIMIVGVSVGTATITVSATDGQVESATLELRVVDVNGDGSITAADVTALYDYFLNGDNTYIDNSDVNGDGNITSADITTIYNILLGN